MMIQVFPVANKVKFKECVKLVQRARRESEDKKITYYEHNFQQQNRLFIG